MVGSSIVRKLESSSKITDLLRSSREDTDLFSFLDTKKTISSYKPDLIINAAAKVGGINANNTYRTDFIIENLKINMNIFESSTHNPEINIINLGSSCIYPLDSPNPIKESYFMNGKLEPTNSPYAMAKIASIEIGRSINQQYGNKVINLMPTNLYGINDYFSPTDSHVIPGLISRMYDAKSNKDESFEIWGSGKPLREFLYVDDLADACLFILDKWNSSKGRVPKDKKGKEIYWLNVGSPFEISIKDLAKKIAEEIGFEGEILWDKDMPDGTPRKKLDTSKINALGWEAKTNLEEGIRLTLSHFEKEMSNQTIRN